MSTRWMTAAAMLAICAIGCSNRIETPPSEPSSVPKEVSESETGEAPKSPFKAVESEVIEDMQPAVAAADTGLKKIEPTGETPPAPPMSVAEPIVSTTRPVEPPVERAPVTDEDDEKKKPSDTADDRRRRRPTRRRPFSGQGGSGIMVSGGMMGSPVFTAIPPGPELGAGSFGADAMGLPEFGSDEFAEDGGSFGGFAGGGPAEGHGIALGTSDEFDLIGDDLAETTDGFSGPGGGHDGATGPGGGHGGPADGGLSPAPPVPPPDF